MMTNKERYKQAFSAVQSSRQLCLEVEEVKKSTKKIWQLRRQLHAHW